MGHQVNYIGSLKLKESISKEQEEFFIQCTENYKEYDRLSALEFNKDKTALLYFDCDKIYPDIFYNEIEKFITEFKKLGNDFTEGSYFISCSEYGLDSEAIIFYYSKNKFHREKLLKIAEDYIVQQTIKD